MKRKGFTLIELMIVIVIIGVVYVLAITSLRNISDKSKNLTLQNLPQFMESIHSHDELLLTCIDSCRACYLFRDGEFEDEIDSFMDEDIRVYEFDVNLGANEIYFTPFMMKRGVSLMSVLSTLSLVRVSTLKWLLRQRKKS